VTETVLHASGLCKSFVDGERRIDVLTNLEMSLDAGESLAIIGRSGTGKSTLLNLLGGLDVPTEGYVEVSGRRLQDMSESERCQWRNQQLGFVFQFHHLMPEFSALESVAMPARIGGVSRGDALAKARDLLCQMGLEHRLEHRPAQLSGGERQRVAIARALVNQPRVVLMDEPTGNLDPESAAQVLSLMSSLEAFDSAFIVVTHDLSIAQRMSSCLRLSDGVLVPA
jgi:lipoprotein-releasing system ATP-binding protein